MQTYFFVSTTYPNVRAFTYDQTGGQLPAAYAPWQRTCNDTVVSHLGDPVIRAIERDGFFLVTGVGRKDTRSRPHTTIT